jgi:hypothetical protein
MVERDEVGYIHLGRVSSVKGSREIADGGSSQHLTYSQSRSPVHGYIHWSLEPPSFQCHVKHYQNHPSSLCPCLSPPLSALSGAGPVKAA